MSEKPTVGFCDGAILWHVDDNGVSWWGSPAARAERLAEERSRPFRIAAEEAARAEQGDQLAHDCVPRPRSHPRRGR